MIHGAKRNGSYEKLLKSMKKIFCILLALTLVLGSFALAFADNGYEPLGGGWLVYNGYTGVVHPSRIDEYSYNLNNSVYNSSSSFTFNNYVGNTETNQSLDVTLKIVAPSDSFLLIGNTVLKNSANISVSTVTDAQRFTLLDDGASYMTTSVGQAIRVDAGVETRISYHLDTVNNWGNNVAFFYAKGNEVSQNGGSITVEYMKIGDVVVVGNDPLAGLTVDTYAFTVPYGSNVKFTAERIDSIYVRYDTGDRKVGSYFGSTIPTAKYSYNGTPNTLTALQSAISMPLKGYGKRNLIGAYSTFECYLLPNGKQINVFNPLNPDNDSVAYGDMYVNITTLGAPKAVYYSPNGSVQIINGSSDAVNDEGNSSTIGGSGTVDDPYIQTPTYNDGTTVNLDNISFGDNTNNDGVIANFVAVIQSLFSIPSSIVSNLGQWVSGLGDVVSSLFGAMPPQITSMVVTFFSAVLLIGIIKMFL